MPRTSKPFHLVGGLQRADGLAGGRFGCVGEGREEEVQKACLCGYIFFLSLYLDLDFFISSLFS